jgi:peptidoglycan/LPS O-acetylase OafA/YrhL
MPIRCISFQLVKRTGINFLTVDAPAEDPPDRIKINGAFFPPAPNRPGSEVTENLNFPKRLYSLDILRGVAALGVVLWHWPHFFFLNSKPGSVVVSHFSLHALAFIFYDYGWLAVDLFFGLSGFIFYWLYSNQVSNRTISSAQFGLLRFSRLYPLHLATLLMVAISQLYFMKTYDRFFVYSFNDIRHFFLNLFFVSSWGFENGFSFNGPVWSVSVEVLLYILFFIICRALPVRAIIAAACSAIGFCVVSSFNPAIGRGVGSFFLGGCIYFIYRKTAVSRLLHSIARALVYITFTAWTMTLFFILKGVTFQPIPVFSKLWRIGFPWPILVLFPLTILTLALMETRRGSLGKTFSFIGDISYSSYMLHFPLQLIIVVLASKLSIGDEIFYSWWFAGLFFSLLITLCLLSYHYFEAPLQRIIRRKGMSFLSSQCSKRHSSEI